MAHSLPRIAALTLCAAAIGYLTIVLGFAADAQTAGTTIAIVDFNYVDTSGEVLDQRAEHELRLSVFMSALKDDLAVMRKLFILSACVFACVTVATGTVVFTTLSSVERIVDPAAVAASPPGSRY